MFSWLSYFWSTNPVASIEAPKASTQTNSIPDPPPPEKVKLVLPGPARNAPSTEQNIKSLLAQKTVQILLVTQDEIDDIRSKLRKTVTNATRPPFKKKPLFEEIEKSGGVKSLKNVRET